MNNSIVIDQIREESAVILDQLANRSEQEFKIKNLEIADNGLYLNNVPITGNALKKVLGALRVKENFIEYSKKMTSDEWSDLGDRIKNVQGEDKLYAVFAKEDGKTEIIDAYGHKSDKKSADDASYKQYFDWVISSLEKTEFEFSLKELHFNQKTDQVNLNLLNKSREFDAFGTGVDLWKPGNNFRFNGLSFNYAPFFERLSCSNGAVAQKFGFGSDISRNTFNNNKIQRTIEKAILEEDSNMMETLKKSIHHLKNNNVSLGEFYYYRKQLESKNQEGEYDGILAKYFNDAIFYDMYGENIKSKSQKWLATANSGINAYDMFNSITYLGSHPDEVKIDHNDRVDLQIAATRLLFKKSLDLEDVASPVKFVYPKNFSMN